MLRQRCASSLRGAPVVTTPRKPHQASDCGVQAQVTDPRDGLPAAAGISGQSFSMTPPQAGFVLQAPIGLIDLARTPEIGLADEVGGIVQPRRAAILLFAEEPGSLLAAFDSRADVRVMVYDGKHVASGATPNLRKPAKSARGPLIDQIDTAVKIVLDELADGLTLSASGFKTKHAYPERVVKEAIVNAIVHRDYRLNRDIFVRIFDDRVEVESPGLLPGNITPANIAKAGSRARNPLIASNLREFPTPPNIDAGEGVRMMFAEMALAELYPPQYRQGTDSEVETVTVTLFNALRPSTWDLVSDWLDRNGAIANADLVRMADVDTLKASKQLTAWRDQGLLVPVPGRAKRNMAYMKPGGVEGESPLLSTLRDNNDATEGK